MTTTLLDDTITLTPTPGHSPCHCCVNIFSRGQRAVVTGDMMHHAIQCRELDWSPGVDWDPKAGGGVAPTVLIIRCGYRYAAVADPFPGADSGVGDGGRRSLPLPVQAGVTIQTEQDNRLCRPEFPSAILLSLTLVTKLSTTSAKELFTNFHFS